MLTFRASSSVEVVGRECRGAEDKQAPNRCRVDALAVGGYISRVLFVDGGFCEGNTSYRAFKQVPALNIWPACRVQAWEWEWERAIARGQSAFDATHI